MVKLAKVLDVPVLATEQNPRALGPTVPELNLSNLGPLHFATVSKTLFSMATPEVLKMLGDKQFKSVAIFGIESHICVLQTTLDLLEGGYDVHVIADGVSSCNPEEVPIALERMRQAGAQITTSESLAFQLQRDASSSTFKAFSSLIKEEKDTTKESLQRLLSSHTKHSMV
ncbi:hypothetical protein FOMPIDRAFT_1047103 [Fomitopsis schrenkii]|uniref:Isochorismatase-like domain-containing protein n=1 Tax=Fomitopsis schrenkii TaxID=2126942 RepID=S8EIG1_FOMSC|nr:hypothetical protein FOMPIDRAFT_1047103 [Fomitopsis schrenkii]